MTIALPPTEVERSGSATLSAGIGLVTAACLALLAIFSADIMAALHSWFHAATYSYCILIPPISLFLLFRKRDQLKAMDPRLSLVGAALFLACLAVWASGQVTAITELRQFAVVGLLQATVLALLGWQIYRRISFPMLYLFLMVPSASVLLPPLQTLTAHLASVLLLLCRIPVLVGQTQIDVPHGSYEVAPGCAGLNFLLSSLALSLLFAWTMYHSLAKRLCCVLIALILAIASNALRVFGIIWLAEATQRRIDIVNDHLVYGWLLYGVMMALGMAVGFGFRDSPPNGRRPASARLGRGGTPRPRPDHADWFKLAIAAFLMAALAGAFHARVMLAHSGSADEDVRLQMPAGSGGWRLAGAPGQIAPGLFFSSYGKDDQTVTMQIKYFWTQHDGHKIGDAALQLTSASLGDDEQIRIILGEAPISASSRHVRDRDGTALMWSFIWIGGGYASDFSRARLRAALAALAGDGRMALITLSAADDDGQADVRLEQFARSLKGLAPALADATLSAY